MNILHGRLSGVETERRYVARCAPVKPREPSRVAAITTRAERGCRFRARGCTVAASRTLARGAGGSDEHFERKSAEFARAAGGLPVQGRPGRGALRRQG